MVLWVVVLGAGAGMSGREAALVTAEVPAQGPRVQTKGLDSSDDVWVYRAQGHSRTIIITTTVRHAPHVRSVLSTLHGFMHVNLISKDDSYSQPGAARSLGWAHPQQHG